MQQHPSNTYLFFIHFRVHHKIATKYRNSEVTVLIPVTISTKIISYYLMKELSVFTFHTNYPVNSKMDVMGGANMKLDAYRVATP